jgi:phosphoribosylanthranilate isomerase
VDRLPEPVIKVCGVRDRGVLEAALGSGASAIGFNFVSWSRRRVEVAEARALRAWAEARGGLGEVRWVGVFADVDWGEVLATRAAVGLDWAQLHGVVDAAHLDTWRAACPVLRAFGLADEADAEVVLSTGDDQVLVDARRADGRTGGTGERVDAALLDRVCGAPGVAGRGGVIVAGGLRAHTVGALVSRWRPAGVDTASGAEDDAGRPSPKAAAAFVAAARAAYAGVTKASESEEDR